MANIIIKRPIITEKSEVLSEREDKYVFEVDVKAKKPAIKSAIEDMFGVKVKKVNTNITPAKEKLKGTKSGFVLGRTPKFKKAFITLEEGYEIDIYGDL